MGSLRVIQGVRMGFWIGRPFASVNDGFTAVPEFWSCANKMVIYLLKKRFAAAGIVLDPIV